MSAAAEPDRRIVELRDIHKRFGSVEVLRGVSLRVDEKQVVTIIGPSGSGKSTLLRCINFLAPADSGEIWLDGKWRSPPRERIYRHAWQTYRERKELQRVRADVGMVFQHFNVFPHLTACANVSLAVRKVLGMGRAEAEIWSHEQLERVGLGQKLHVYPRQLSGGQKQRVAIARALALKPKIMLFDEATSALDPELVTGVLQQMRELADGGMTMIVVTHEMRFAFDVSDRIIFMDEGRIVESGPPSQFRAPTHERTRAFLAQIV